jgi:oligopeptide transport system substrate-binding protein
MFDDRRNPAGCLRHLVTLTGALTLLALAGCSGEGPARGSGGPVGGESGTELAERQVLRRGNQAEPQSLDPHKSEGVPSSNIQRDLFEGLVSNAPDGSLVPGAAQSWQISNDGRVYTFRLRADARWSNGDPVTAQDFVFSFRRILDPATLSRYTFILFPIRHAEPIAAGVRPTTDLAVSAPDDHTLVIELENATPYFLDLLTHSASYPVHLPSVTAHGERFTRPGNLVSNGAFQLEDWVVQSHVKLVRNPYYWDNDATVLDEVWFYNTEDQNAELRRYRAHELDMTYNELPRAQIPWLRENLPDELVISPYFGTYYYGFNLTRPPFAGNVALRRALALAIDRDIITGQVTAAGELPSFGWVPPVDGYPNRQMPEAGWSQAEREQQARRLYQEAGYSRERPLRVEVLYNTLDDHRRVAVAIASMWREVLGVEVRLTNQEWRVFLDTRHEKNTEVFRAGWIGDYYDPYTFLELYLSNSELNDSGYASAAYDGLLRDASAELDSQRRHALMAEAEALLLEDLPIMPIYHYVSPRLVKPWVAGFVPNIMERHYSKHLRILRH